jgi:DNA-directed RNA polymerase specialized sigma24 family protein
MSDDMNPQREMTLGEQLQDHIKKSDSQINYLEVTEKKCKDEAASDFRAIAEIIIARRHIEDANNRLKRAYNILPEDQR